MPFAETNIFQRKAEHSKNGALLLVKIEDEYNDTRCPAMLFA